MLNKIIKDLHGHTFKVVDYNLLPLSCKNFPIINEKENLSLQSDTQIKRLNSFILAEYNDTYYALYNLDNYKVLCILKLIEYNKEKDIRYGKCYKNT